MTASTTEATDDSAHGRAARRAVDIGKALQDYVRAALKVARYNDDDASDIAESVLRERAAADAHGALWDLIGGALGKAHTFDVVAETQPTTLKDAVAAMWAAQVGYEGAIEEARRTLHAWRDADVMGSRVRRAAVKRLMLPVGDGGAGLSATAADKAASDDEAYANHKDLVARLLNAKDDAETERDVWFARLLSARETCAAFRQESAASGEGAIAALDERTSELAERLTVLEDRTASRATPREPTPGVYDVDEADVEKRSKAAKRKARGR